MHISVPVEGTVELINFTQISPLVSKCQIKVLYVDDKPNRNGSIINKETAEKMGRKLPGSPIVGYYNEDSKDFEQHNKQLHFSEDGKKIGFVDMTKPYGFVPTDAKVWFQQFQDDDNITRLYLCTEGILWTEAYPETKRILESGNNQSMKLNEETLKGHWTQELNRPTNFFIINEATIENLCILGEAFEPCFEGGQIKKEFSLNKELEKLQLSLYSKILSISNEGGNTFMENKDTVIPQENQDSPTSTVEFEKKDPEVKEEENKSEQNSQDKTEKENNPKNKNNTEEKPKEEDKSKDTKEVKKNYNLNEIPEYIEVVTKYQALQTSYAALETEKNNLLTEVQPLREFKLKKEREEKQNMINSFYMLSDEDKKDVLTNIDTYSLDDIEGKLSVICVRNKVSFTAPDATRSNELNPLTYNLNAAVNQDDSEAPDWLKAVREVEKTMN